MTRLALDLALLAGASAGAALLLQAALRHFAGLSPRAPWGAVAVAIFALSVFLALAHERRGRRGRDRGRGAGELFDPRREWWD